MVSYILSEPVRFGSEIITRFELQPLKAKHLRGLPDKPGMTEMLNLVSKSSGQPTPVVDEVSASDALALVEIIGSFLQPFRGTGSSASES